MANNVVVTTKARKKLVLARAGAKELPPIVGIAFGNGGVDESDNVRAPTENQTTLTSELFRKEIDGYTVLEDAVATVKYECTLLENEMANMYISELGLYDAEGDLVCIKTFKKKGKDDDVEMTFTLDDVF